MTDYGIEVAGLEEINPNNNKIVNKKFYIGNFLLVCNNPF